MKKERTFIAVKSDGIQRHLVGEVIQRFEQHGLKLVACKLVVVTKEKVEAQYPDEEWWYQNTAAATIKSKQARGIDVTGLDPLELGKSIRERLIASVVGRPIVAMVWEGANAVRMGRKIAGSTSPLDADVGTIRGDFSIESYELADSVGMAVRNTVHASGSVKEAEQEVNLWFGEGEIVDYPLLVEDLLYGRDWGLCHNYGGG